LFNSKGVSLFVSRQSLHDVFPGWSGRSLAVDLVQPTAEVRAVIAGIEGKMFKPMALTVVFALSGSLILSLTYVPAAMTFLLRGPVSERDSVIIRYAKRWYGPALGYVTRNRAGALAVGRGAGGRERCHIPVSRMKRLGPQP
jgi:hypothetical protein